MKSKSNIVVLKTENQQAFQLDWLKWVIVSILLLAGIVGNYYYSGISVPIRLAVWLVLLLAAGFVGTKTLKGRWVVDFFRDSRMELRKVVWPTREETMQTTLVVAAMVIILAILLWGMDSVLVWAIGWLTGQRS